MHFKQATISQHLSPCEPLSPVCLTPSRLHLSAQPVVVLLKRPHIPCSSNSAFCLCFLSVRVGASFRLDGYCRSDLEKISFLFCHAPRPRFVFKVCESKTAFIVINLCVSHTSEPSGPETRKCPTFLARNCVQSDVLYSWSCNWSSEGLLPLIINNASDCGLDSRGSGKKKEMRGTRYQREGNTLA